MEGILNVLAYGAAFGCLGIGFVFALLFLVARLTHTAGEDDGCFTRLVVLLTLTAALYFLYVAVAP